MRISRYLRSQTLKSQFWQRTQTNVSSSLIVRFWNRLVFWKLGYVTSQTCVWGLQTETQTPSTSFVLNRTDWDIHHQTKGTLSTRKVVLVSSEVSCLFCWDTVCSLVSTVCTTQQELPARNNSVNCVCWKGNSEQRDSSWKTDIERRDKHLSWGTGTPVTTLLTVYRTFVVHFVVSTRKFAE